VTRSRAGLVAVLVLLAAAPAQAMHLGKDKPAGMAPAPIPSSRGVLVIGDSLEVGTAPYLEGLLPGQSVTVDAQKSRPSPDGVAILRRRLRPHHGVVVFDLGVNNSPGSPQILAADLASVLGLAGDRCIVVGTLARPPLGGATIAAANEVVRGFAAQNPQVRLFDWRGATLSRPGLLAGDGAHGTSSGYAFRAQLVAQAVQSCFIPPPSSAPQAGREQAAPSGPSKAELRRRRAARLARERATRARAAQAAVTAQTREVLRSLRSWLP
jgi:hypothetical protein